MENIRESKSLLLLMSIAVALFILSFSIAVPILFRPFYYLHIDSLNLVEVSGFEQDEIKQAYNDMMDYCTGLTKEFSVGKLKWSESGKSHFEDVRKLFLLDFAVVIITGLTIFFWIATKPIVKVRPYKVLGRGPTLWGSVLLVVTFGIIGGLAAIDFDRAFVLFHKLFFPGKDNWLFDYDVDQVIRILPEEFFMNCGVAILAMVVLLCTIAIFIDLTVGKGRKKYKQIKQGA